MKNLLLSAAIIGIVIALAVLQGCGSPGFQKVKDALKDAKTSVGQVYDKLNLPPPTPYVAPPPEDDLG